MPLLRVNNLILHFRGVTALSDVSFEVRRGALHAVIGPNGAGKTSWPPSRPTLTTLRQPGSAMPRSAAIRAETRASLPTIASSSGVRSLSVGMWRRGTTSTCTGAWGLMSSKATTSSSS